MKSGPSPSENMKKFQKAIALTAQTTNSLASHVSGWLIATPDFGRMRSVQLFGFGKRNWRTIYA